MTKREVVSSPNTTALLSHIRRPADYLLSISKFLQSLRFKATVDVVFVPDHGLAGMPFNKTKVA